jgi:general secretion pathway protein G
MRPDMLERTRRRVRQGGFTLIEVLVVVVILGILAGLIVPRIMDRPDQARVVAAKNDINAIMNALKLYRLDNGVYPAGDQGLQALVQRPESGNIPRNWKSGGYLERLPKDPWGGDYLYLNPGIHGEVDVVCLGRDRQQGGEGYDADIGSWDAN